MRPPILPAMRLKVFRTASGARTLARCWTLWECWPPRTSSAFRQCSAKETFNIDLYKLCTWTQLPPLKEAVTDECWNVPARSIAYRRNANERGCHQTACIKRLAAVDRQPIKSLAHLFSQQGLLPDQGVVSAHLKHPQHHKEDVLADMPLAKVWAGAMRVAGDVHSIHCMTGPTAFTL
jgi:hypothetical protein